VSFNGEPVKDITSFRNRVAMIKPDTNVNLEVLREGQHQSFSLHVGKLPDSASMAGKGKESVESSWGLSVQTLNQQLAEQLGVEVSSGVVVTGVDPASVAATAGVRPGMVVTEVNRKPVTNAKDFDEAIKAGKDSNTLLLLVKVGGHTQYLVLQKTN
jgi:serine protease Do